MQIKRYTKFLKLFTGIISTFILVSCVNEHDPGLKSGGKEEAMVTFVLQLPGKNSPVTRTVSETYEDDVAEINVLVFKSNGGEYIYTARCSGSDITTDTGNSRLKTFTVKLRQGAFDIAILANAHNVIQSASLDGLSKDEALSQLKTTMPVDGKWPVNNFKPFPMWGNVGNITIDDNVDLTGGNRIKLTRMIARVDVQITGEAINSFKLTSVDIYNYHTEGMLVPRMADWDETTDPDKPKVTAPHLSTTSILVEDPITYDETVTDVVENVCTGEIYIFEAENHSDVDHARPKTLTDRTCLVIGGIWDSGGIGNFTGETTYYRVDFSEGTGVSQKYLDVLRNHHYLFNITKVSGFGYDQSYTAFASGPVNIEAEVLEWNDADLGDIVFNGQNYLSVAPGVFEFSGDGRQEGVSYNDNILYVKTDYKTTGTDSKSGWYVEQIVDATDEKTVVNWLTLIPGEGSPGIKTKVVLTFDENSESEARSAIVVIAAGRLRYKVRVTQTVTPETELKIYDPVSGASLSMLLFDAGVGVNPGEMRFRVEWKPVTSTLFITNNKMGAIEFPSDAGTGTPVTGTINNGTGTIEYLIKPPVVQLSDIDPLDGGDPFLDRVSNINFCLSNGATFISKSIMLRQINYNLLAEYNESGYVINGSEYVIPVRSNSAWVVSDITGDTEILANQAEIKKQTGGYNTTTGDPLKIKVIPMSEDGANNGKTAYIHLKEINDKCAPVVIVFKGIECGIDGVAAPIKIGVNGYNNTNDDKKTYLTYMYGEKCWMVQNLREGDPANKQYPSTPHVTEGERGYYYSYSEAKEIGCPAGWHLPSRSEFEELIELMNDADISRKYWWANPDNLAGYGNSSYTWAGWNSRGRWLSSEPKVAFSAIYNDTDQTASFRVFTSVSQEGVVVSSIRCILNE